MVTIVDRMWAGEGKETVLVEPEIPDMQSSGETRPTDHISAR